MLLSDGSRVAAADVMTEFWTGKRTQNRCPQITSFTASKSQNLKPGTEITVTLSAKDPESDKLWTKWVITQDSSTIGVGGDAQDAEGVINSDIKSNGNTAIITVPQKNGAYRIFAYVYDRQGGAAVANIPIQVAGKEMPSGGSELAVKLPFVVYADDASQTTYVPSGFMGNSDAVKMTLDSTENPYEGKTCLKAEYNSADNWGGVLWQSPANDWDGKLPGGANLTGATQLEFWARGANGGETVNFVFGVLDGNQPYRDTAKGELKNVVLTNQWKKLTMPLKGRDLSRIKTGFGWSLAGQGKPVTFFLDDIRYVTP